MTDYFHFVCTRFLSVFASSIDLQFLFFFFFWLYVLVTFDYVGVNIADISSSTVLKAAERFFFFFVLPCFFLYTFQRLEK